MVKIAGIVTIGVAFLGLLVFALIWFDRRAKQQESERQHRMATKRQEDEFTLKLFDKILEDRQLEVERLALEATQKDREIERLMKKNERMKIIMAKANLKEAEEEVLTA
jgi:hypothetical protein